jgi:DNA segregation ATPase FtsK/SpoIIIE, S-DNA-T family
MASYQARQRDPLLDQGTQAMLEKRGRELVGLALIGLAIAFVLMLGSYSPDDPGWMVATEDPAANVLGRFGAALASTLIIIGGKGAWSIPLVLAAWGLRFVLHRGADRAVSRIVFAVIAIAMTSVYTATLVPPATWTHSFGLGGLFGDTVLGALLGVVPGGAGFGLKLISLGAFAAMVAMMLFVMGFNLAELRAGGRFLITSLVLTYSILIGAAGKGAAGTARAAAAIQERRRTAAVVSQPEAYHAAPAWRAEAPAQALAGRRPVPVHAEPAVTAPGYGRPETLRAEPRYAEPLAEAPQYAPSREKVGLLARMPALMRRTVEPESELIEPRHDDEVDDFGLAPSDDRIKARISDVIKSRTRPAHRAASGCPGAGSCCPCCRRPCAFSAAD